MMFTAQLSASVHIVKEGESLYTIAKKHKTTIRKLCKVNGLKKNATLQIGQKLTLSTPNYLKGKKLTTYKVKKGDTLSGIGSRYEVKVAVLKQINQLTSSKLKIGQKLQVPQKRSDAFAKYPSSTKKPKETKVASATVIEKNKEVQPITLGSLLSFLSAGEGLTEAEKKEREIIDQAKQELGKKYVWGASGKKGTYDCSSFTKFVYEKNGIKLPRTSYYQARHGEYIPRDELKKGDLVFFDTSKRRKGYVNHVGIYMGDGNFIHASSAKKKVIITPLNKRFYSQRYMGARRPS